MKHHINSLYLNIIHLNRQHLQLLMLVLSLVLLVVGAGAPFGGGDGRP